MGTRPSKVKLLKTRGYHISGKPRSLRNANHLVTTRPARVPADPDTRPWVNSLPNQKRNDKRHVFRTLTSRDGCCMGRLCVAKFDESRKYQPSNIRTHLRCDGALGLPHFGAGQKGRRRARKTLQKKGLSGHVGNPPLSGLTHYRYETISGFFTFRIGEQGGPRCPKRKTIQQNGLSGHVENPELSAATL